MNSCRFCEIQKGNNVYGEVDNPILVNREFFTLVSIGAFIKGWVLIIPKKHSCNMKEYYVNNDFFEYLQKVILNIRSKMNYKGNFIIFEHGPNHFGSEVACGTNHAHLHVVPYEKSILEKIQKDKNWIKTKWYDIDKIVADKEYLLYCEYVDDFIKGDTYINIVEKPESQYFRKILAQEMGIENQYSYKEYLHNLVTMETYKMLIGE